MITTVLFFTLTSLGSFDLVGDTHGSPSQIRPGTFSGAKTDPAKLAETDAIEQARVRARELDREGKPREALAVLLPWRKKATTSEGMSLYYPFLKAYIQLDDLKGYLGLTEEKYNVLSASTTTSVTADDVLRYATALYVNGRREQAWQLCQRHTDLFTENFYDNRMKEYKDKPITPATLGDALLRGSARLDSSLSMYFYLPLVHERPNDAEVHYLFARSLPDKDLMTKKIHMEQAVALAEGETKADYKRYLDGINWDLKSREKQASGGQGVFFSIGG